MFLGSKVILSYLLCRGPTKILFVIRKFSWICSVSQNIYEYKQKGIDKNNFALSVNYRVSSYLALYYCITYIFISIVSVLLLSFLENTLGILSVVGNQNCSAVIRDNSMLVSYSYQREYYLVFARTYYWYYHSIKFGFYSTICVLCSETYHVNNVIMVSWKSSTKNIKKLSWK